MNYARKERVPHDPTAVSGKKSYAPHRKARCINYAQSLRKVRVPHDPTAVSGKKSYAPHREARCINYAQSLRSAAVDEMNYARSVRCTQQSTRNWYVVCNKHWCEAYTSYEVKEAHSGTLVSSTNYKRRTCWRLEASSKTTSTRWKLRTKNTYHTISKHDLQKKPAVSYFWSCDDSSASLIQQVQLVSPRWATVSTAESQMGPVQYQ